MLLSNNSKKAQASNLSVPLYGRRKGKKLSKNLCNLVKSELPKHSINISQLEDQNSLKDLFLKEYDQIWLEIGFGSGEHILEQAKQNPTIGFLGIEVYENGIAKFLSKNLKQGIKNIKLIKEDARLVLPVLKSNSLNRVFLLFPDPWPKKKHEKRRFISNQNLLQLARTIAPGGELRIATDHPIYINWCLKTIQKHKSFKWMVNDHTSWTKRPKDGFATRYEIKALGDGRKPIYLNFKRV